MTHSQLNIALNRYFNGILQNDLDSALAEFGETTENVLEEIAEADLVDKGFTDEEIDQIICRQLNKETAYKFMAYFILLYTDFNSSNELMNVIEEHPDLSLDEFNEEDIDSIFLISDTLVW